MPTRTWIYVAELIVIAALASAVFVSWRADRRDRAQLAATLAAANQQLSAADARQHDRDAQLHKTLAALAAAKRDATSPAQILRSLPTALPLPAPITLLDARHASPQIEPHGRGAAAPKPAAQDFSRPKSEGNPVPASLPAISWQERTLPETRQAAAVIPAQDLKPLYDFALDCQACRAKLAAAQGDLADEQAKSAALGKERDAAVQAVKGGSLWRRLRRAAKWFAIGALAGAAASHTVR